MDEIDELKRRNSRLTALLRLLVTGEVEGLVDRSQGEDAAVTLGQVAAGADELAVVAAPRASC